MGAGEVSNQSQPSFTEIFEEVWPHFLVMGMSYDQFWDGDPGLVKAYRKADELKRKRQNEQMWLQGIYIAEALSATVGNMFSKGNKHKYPAEPFPITQFEMEERKERERKAKMERMKAAFTARALSVNAKLGGEEK